MRERERRLQRMKYLITTLLCVVGPSSAFVAVSPHLKVCTPASSGNDMLRMSLQEGPSNRGDFLSSAAGTIAAAAGLGMVTGGLRPGAAVADQLGDLDGGAPMPMGAVKLTEGEPLSEEAARIQRKLAAQAKLNGKTSSGQMTYGESRAAEGEKQQRLKDEANDKARRRAAMCENLGRGC
ncbi:unnamed protein product [Ectocarpus sp. 8 AP-2014]